MIGRIGRQEANLENEADFMCAAFGAILPFPIILF